MIVSYSPTGGAAWAALHEFDREELSGKITGFIAHCAKETASNGNSPCSKFHLIGTRATLVMLISLHDDDTVELMVADILT